MTPTGVRRGTFEVSWANQLANIELPTLLGKGVSNKAYANPGIPTRVNKAEVAVKLHQTVQAKPAPKKTKPVQRYAEQKAVFDEKRQCKARPTNTQGNGNSRPWVSWCK